MNTSHFKAVLGTLLIFINSQIYATEGTIEPATTTSVVERLGANVEEPSQGTISFAPPSAGEIKRQEALAEQDMQ